MKNLSKYNVYYDISTRFVSPLHSVYSFDLTDMPNEQCAQF